MYIALPEKNIAPINQWLEVKKIYFRDGLFLGAMSGLGRVLDSYLFGWGPKSSKMSVESNVLVEIADDQLDEVHFLASTGRNPNLTLFIRSIEVREQQRWSKREEMMDLLQIISTFYQSILVMFFITTLQW